MSKFRAWGLPRKARRVVKVEFEDPRDGSPCVIYLGALSVPMSSQASEHAVAMYADWGPEGDGYPWPPEARQEPITQAFCNVVASVLAMECDEKGNPLDPDAPDPDQRPYTAADVVGLLTCDDAIGFKVATAVGDLNRGTKDSAESFTKATEPA